MQKAVSVANSNEIYFSKISSNIHQNGQDFSERIPDQNMWDVPSHISKIPYGSNLTTIESIYVSQAHDLMSAGKISLDFMFSHAQGQQQGHRI